MLLDDRPLRRGGPPGGPLGPRRMALLVHVPPPPLSGFVELFWHYEGYDVPHAKERCLPTGTVELIVNLREDGFRVYDRRDPGRFRTLRGALVSGAYSGFFVTDTASQGSTVGVHFKPGGALPFFGLPACELRDEHVSLEALWGTGAGELRDRLLEAPTPQARFRLLEEALLARATRPLEQHPAVAFALAEFRDAPRGRTVSDVTGRIGLSHRRFIKLFDEEVGLTPKLFWRVRRFQEALRRAGSGRPVEWAEVALACGYFDQAHFIRDFREFSGVTPTAYLGRRGEHLNHVALDDP